VVHITRQTLGFYREITSPVMSSVPQLFEEVLAAYDARIEEHQIVVHKHFGDVGELSAFPGELRQVFSNLVLNALEASPASGKVSIRVKQVHDGQGRLGIQITVADQGPGIPRRNMQQIFEPFFSTKDSKGTGLGLWVSQGIVQKNRGKIRVRSNMGELQHGTCFVVFLPFSAVEQNSVHQKELVLAEELSNVMVESTAGRSDDLSAA